MRIRLGLIAGPVMLLIATMVFAPGFATPRPVAASAISVSIQNFAFSPAAITVKPGDTVTWTNNDSVAHTVTAVGGSFDTGQIEPGESASITFSDLGTFAYKCSNHPSMTGSVKVAPSITLDKDKSKYNGSVKATLIGFTPNKLITVTWPDATQLFQVTSDSSGNAHGTFRTPLSPLGAYKVTAKDTNGKTATTTLHVIPRIMLAPSSTGPIGTQFRVYFYGFSAGEHVDIRWYTPDGAHFQVLKTVSIAANGRASTLVNVPTGSAVGTHKISGNVVGVSRSASTTYSVTATQASNAALATSTNTATPTATMILTSTPTLVPTIIATTTPTIVPTATETAAPTETPVISPSETPTPVSTATETPTGDPATPIGAAA